MASRTPTRVSSRPGSTASRTPSRTGGLAESSKMAQGHFLSPSMAGGGMPIDPELLAMEEEGSDRDAEGSEEDAEGEVEDDLDMRDDRADSLQDGIEVVATYPSQASQAGSSRSRRSYEAVVHSHARDPLESPSSQSPGPPSRKRARSNRAPPSFAPAVQTNGHIPRPKIKPTPTAGAMKGKGKGKAVGRSQAVPSAVAIPEAWCSFCQLTETNREGKPEKMVSCTLCGRSGHFSCLSMTVPDLIRAVQSYDWVCIECKTCEVCAGKGNDGDLMFCDGCDRGWHTSCTDPPLKKPPKGTWYCIGCRHRHAQSLVPPSSAKPKGKGKGKALDLLPSSSPSVPFKRPPGRPRKDAPPYPDVFAQDIHPRIKVRKSRPKTNGTREGSSSGQYSPAPDLPPPRINIRLRIPARKSGGGVEEDQVEEEEEEKVPYGGVIEGAEADTSKTSILEADKSAFERSRKTAEDKLGGPPPVAISNGTGANAWDGQVGSPGSSTPGPSKRAGRSQSLSTTGVPATLVPRGVPQPASRSLRDRLLSSSVAGLGQTPAADPSAGPSTPGPPPSAASLTQGTGPSQKINKIRFGAFDIDTWYSAPYPEEYQYVPEGRLWLCEFCLKFMKSGFVAGRHRMKCKARHPPGDEIYRDGTISVFEVDGRKNKIYCQNLCLLAKMFLDHKTLYYDVEPFLFYVMTEVDDLGARFVGYFSKEKRSPDNNVSCIMTLPVRQRKGWGQLLIDFSYLLSKKEGRVGSPEKPLSGLGAVTYKKYWQLSVFGYLRDQTGKVTMDDISAATSMTLLDTYTTLKDEDMIRVQPAPVAFRATPSRARGRGRGRGRGRPSLARHGTETDELEPSDDVIKIPDPGTYEITFDRDYIEAVLRKHQSKGLLELKPERLKYHPFLVTRQVTKPAAALATAAVLASGVTATDADHEGDVVDASVIQVNGEHNGELEGNDVAGMQGDSEEIINGEDPATLALVAALAYESPKRNLRNRTSEDIPDRIASTPRERRPRSARNTGIAENGSLRRSGRGDKSSATIAGERDTPVKKELAPVIKVISELESASEEEVEEVEEPIEYKDSTVPSTPDSQEDADAEGEGDEEYVE